MAKVEKVGTPKVTASPRPCAFVSPDPGNAPSIVASHSAVVAGTSDAEKVSVPAGR